LNNEKQNFTSDLKSLVLSYDPKHLHKKLEHSAKFTAKLNEVSVELECGVDFFYNANDMSNADRAAGKIVIWEEKKID